MKIITMRSPRLLIILVCALVGAGLGTVWQALRLAKKPQEFRSVAKLVAGGQIGFNDNVHWREQQLDFYGTIIETLESPEMKRRATARVKALHPDLKLSDVSIRVVQSQGTTLFNLLATGPDPKDTKTFLNALIDEYFAFRKAVRELSQGKRLQQFLQEVAAKEKLLDEAWARLEQVRRKLDTMAARAEQKRLAARLIRLREQHKDLGLQIKTLAADEAAKLQAQLGPIEQEIQTIEAGLQQYAVAVSELDRADVRYQGAKMSFEKVLNGVETYQELYHSSADYVAIQERASPATEYIEDWRLPIAAGAGGLLGALMGLLLSVIIVRPPLPTQLPAAV
jgi:hypothetical protein